MEERKRECVARCSYPGWPWLGQYLGPSGGRRNVWFPPSSACQIPSVCTGFSLSSSAGWGQVVAAEHPVVAQPVRVTGSFPSCSVSCLPVAACLAPEEKILRLQEERVSSRYRNRACRHGEWQQKAMYLFLLSSWGKKMGKVWSLAAQRTGWYGGGARNRCLLTIIERYTSFTPQKDWISVLRGLLTYSL